MIAEPLALSRSDRAELERMARSTALPHRSVRQAKALLWAADGVAADLSIVIDVPVPVAQSRLARSAADRLVAARRHGGRGGARHQPADPA